MTHRSVLLALLALAALTGCATSEVARIAKANDEHVYGLWTGKQGVELVTRECPRPVWDTHTGGWTTPVPCAEVPGTRDPHDTEFWKFELYRVGQVRIAYGLIPVSPKYKSGQSDRVGVVGSQEQCEHFRVQFVKPKGVAGNDGESWTEPCTGPFYFRRMSQEARP